LFELDDVDQGNDPQEARRISENALKAFHNKVRDIILMSDDARAAQGVGVPVYYEQFLELCHNGWPWRVAAYIAWAASPRQGRWPRTQEELAVLVLGLTSDRQIAAWRKKNPAIDDLISHLQVAPMLAHRADVIQALVVSASDPDYKGHGDRKLYLEITGDYTPTSKLVAQLRRSAQNNVADQPDDVLTRFAGLSEDIVDDADSE